MKLKKLINKYVFPILIIILAISFIIYASVKKEGFQVSTPTSASYCPSGSTEVDQGLGCVFCPPRYTFDTSLYYCKPANYNGDTTKLKAPYFCKNDLAEPICPRTYVHNGLTYPVQAPIQINDLRLSNKCVATVWKCPANYTIYPNNRSDLTNGVCRKSVGSRDIVQLDIENPNHTSKIEISSTCPATYTKNTSTGYCVKSTCPANITSTTTTPMVIGESCGNTKRYTCPPNTRNANNKCYPRCPAGTYGASDTCKANNNIAKPVKQGEVNMKCE
jgi:hypothetical protein